MNSNLNLPFSCEDGHDFEMAGEGYYKNDETGNRIPSVVYRMIFCLKCGANLEIIVADRRNATENFTLSDLQKQLIAALKEREQTNVRKSRRTRKSNARNNL